MSDTITIPRSDWRKMNQRLEEVMKIVSTPIYINQEDAAKALGISYKTLGDYSRGGKQKFFKDVHFIENVLGHRFYNINKCKGL